MKNHALLLALCLLLGNSILSAQTNCNDQVSIQATNTTLGSPLEGPYQPGEAVNFCIKIDQFNQANCNWLHGIVPVFGDGWQESSFFTSGQPKEVTTSLVPHTNGFWVWYPENWMAYKTSSVSKNLSPGDRLGAGWFFQNFAQPSINPFDPNFTRGDGTSCTNTDNTWEVCFTIVAKEIYDCPDVVDLSVGFTTFGDGETGSYGTPGCTGDSQVNFNAQLNCCDGARVETITDIFICNEQTISIPLGSDGGPNVTYRWTAQSFNASGASDGVGNLIEQTLNINTIGFTSFVIYNVYAIVDGCEGIAETFKVTISNFTVELGDDLHLCNGQTIRVGEFPVGGISPYTYQWEHGPDHYRPQVSPTETTTYTVTVTDAVGCTVSDDITVFIGQAGPIEGPESLCGLTTASYSIPVFPGTISYVWTVPSGAAITSGQGTTAIEVDWGTSSGGELCVRPTGGCVSGLIDNCITVAAGAQPVVDGIFGNLNPCIFSTESYSVSSTEPNVQFNWTIEGGTIVSGQDTDEIMVEWTSVDAGIVNVLITGPCGFIQKVLDVNGFISTTVSLNGTTSICPNEVATYTAQAEGGSQPFFYQWTVPSGAQILSGQGTTDLQVDWGNSTGGEVWVVATGECGGVGENVSVNLFDGSTLDILGTTTVCAGEEVTFSVTPELPIGATIQWSFPNNFQLLSSATAAEINGIWVNDNDGVMTVVVDACGSPSFDTQVINASGGSVVDTAFVLCPGACVEFQGEMFCDEGAYTLTGSGSGNCGAVFNIDISFLSASNVTANAGNDTNVGCTVNTILDGTASNYPANSTIQWKDADGVVVGTEITLEVSEAGVYTLEIFNSLSQCFDSDAVLVSPAAPPTADAGSDLWINCFNNFQTQLQAVQNPNWSYAWTGPNGFSSNVARPIVTVPGIYILEVVDSATGCGSDTDEVIVQDDYILDIEFEQSICNDANGSAQVIHQGILDPIFEWSNGNTGESVDQLAAGLYEVTVTGLQSNGCSEILTIEVTADLSCKIVIAGNVFDDGENGDCDPSDSDLSTVEDIEVNLAPLGLVTYTDEFGYYEFLVDTGSYEITVAAPAPYFVLCPGFQSIEVTSFDTSTVSAENYFFLDYLTNFNLFLTGSAGSAVSGQSQNIQTQNCNYAPQTINGRIELIHDPLVTFDPVANGADSYDPATRTASWLFAGLSYFQCDFLSFSVDIPAGVPEGTLLTHTVVALPLLGDNQPSNNTIILNRIVRSPTSNQLNVAPISTEAVFENYALDVYPNPASNKLTISSKKDNPIFSFKLLNIAGKDMLQNDLGEEGVQKVVVDLPEGLTTGLYLLEVTSTQGTTVKKVFVQQF